MSKPKRANEPPEDRPGRLGELEDALKAAEQRVSELRAERDSDAELIGRQREALENHRSTMDAWKEAHDMTLNAEGLWEFSDGHGEKYHALLIQYRDLLRDWNKHVSDFNSMIASKPPGRPLNASPAQCEQVLALRKRKLSLRDIADEMTLAVATVRTIVDRSHRTDRTTMKRLRRLDPQNSRLLEETNRKKMRAALPGRINRLIVERDELIKESKK
jgi:hypothetical protein